MANGDGWSLDLGAGVVIVRSHSRSAPRRCCFADRGPWQRGPHTAFAPVSIGVAGDSARDRECHRQSSVPRTGAAPPGEGDSRVPSPELPLTSFRRGADPGRVRGLRGGAREVAQLCERLAGGRGGVTRTAEEVRRERARLYGPWPRAGGTALWTRRGTAAVGDLEQRLPTARSTAAARVTWHHVEAPRRFAAEKGIGQLIRSVLQHDASDRHAALVLVSFVLGCIEDL